jgi:hypothetical protein
MLVSNSVHKDRIMNHSECKSINEVDRVFRLACHVILKMTKLLESADREGGKIKFDCNEKKFEYTRIASKSNSQVQMLHCDYTPKEVGYEYDTIKIIKDEDGNEKEEKQYLLLNSCNSHFISSKRMKKIMGIKEEERRRKHKKKLKILRLFYQLYYLAIIQNDWLKLYLLNFDLYF